MDDRIRDLEDKLAATNQQLELMKVELMAIRSAFLETTYSQRYKWHRERFQADPKLANAELIS
jgi:hypothetical protein